MHEKELHEMSTGFERLLRCAQDSTSVLLKAMMVKKKRFIALIAQYDG